MTNGDRIRQMSNKELASKFGYPCPPLPNKHCCGISNEECTECWLAWLNAPAESEGGKMSKVIICPVCGGMNIQTERRPDGDRHCLDCGSRWKIGSEQVSKKQTIFACITASPDALAEKLVYCVKFVTVGGKGFDRWYSTLLPFDKDIYFYSREEAYAATVAKLKEVEK